MKKKEDEAFLKSIIGTSPIKKNNRVERVNPTLIKDIKTQKKPVLKKEDKEEISQSKKFVNQSYFSLEKSSINKKLKKGKVPVDRRVDFHGMSLLDAEDFFYQTIISCYKINLRCILFITGKGIQRKNNDLQSGEKLYYGKIRQSFFLWVKKKEMQSYILAVEQASIEYGADGAFFVYLRKIR